MRFIFILFLFLAPYIILAQEVTTKTYSVIQTNWSYYTNSWNVRLGNVTNDDIEKLYDNHPSAYIGIINSNNYISVYYKGELKENILLESKEIEEIKIRWEDYRIYRTNYNKF